MNYGAYLLWVRNGNKCAQISRKGDGLALSHRTRVTRQIAL